MSKEIDHNIYELQNVDWTNVRPIYKQLSTEFPTLTQSFGFSLDESTSRYLDHLIISIDVVDEVLDEISDKNSRDELSQLMIRFLKGEDDLLKSRLTTKALNYRLSSLRKIINTKSVADQFIKAAHTIFKYTESKRHTTDLKQLLEDIQIEGKATADMPLSIIGDQTNRRFNLFFGSLCKLMGIVDLIFDARDDYRTNKISIRPSLRMYMQLIKITVKSGLKLLSLAPKKWTFLKYCLRFGFSLLKGG